MEQVQFFSFSFLTFIFRVKLVQYIWFAHISKAVADMKNINIAVNFEVLYALWLAYLHLTLAHFTVKVMHIFTANISGLWMLIDKESISIIIKYVCSFDWHMFYVGSLYILTSKVMVMMHISTVNIW